MSDDTTANGAALSEALVAALEEHHWMAETDPPEGVDPYLWCVCGWRSDDFTDAHWASGRHAQLAHAHVASHIAARVAPLLAERDALRGKVAAVQALLNGALMVPQAEVRRALDAPAAAQPDAGVRERAPALWSAARDLLALKDGPRDSLYYERKADYWDRLRAAVEAAATHPTTPHGSDQGERGRA